MSIKNKTFYVFIFMVMFFQAETSSAFFASFFEKVKTAVFLNSESESDGETAQVAPVLKPYFADAQEPYQMNEDVLEVRSGPMRFSTEEVDFPAEDTISIYEVKQGDTVSVIAGLFKVSRNTILWANNLQPGEKLVPGQTLIILPVTGLKYTTKKGDTVTAIAKRYKADPDDIARYNGVTKENEFAVGQEIIIPEGEIPQERTPLRQSAQSRGKLATAPVGFFVKPLKSYIRSQGIHGKNAVDLAASIGTKTVAVAKGRVLVARSSGYNGGYGRMIVIAHDNNIQTLYAHLSEVYVTSGATVEQGQVIGATGNSGRSTGPHLHIEVRGAVNPF